MARLINDEIVWMPEFEEPKVKQKTQAQRQRRWRHNQRKSALNIQLSHLPAFSMDQSYELTFINSLTGFFGILHLIELAQQTTTFTMDTELDGSSYRPALIQLQFHSTARKDGKITIIIFEMLHLPPVNSVLYQQIERLVQTIFHSSKTFLVWGEGVDELSRFQVYPLFQSTATYALHFANVQKEFELWCNDQQRQVWGLQMAVAQTFGQFLDKSLTRSNWGVGLDVRLYQNLRLNELNYNVKLSLTEVEDQIRLKLIKYAVDDCFATTKLAVAIGL
ncbi:unnamed protein product [Adineta ricciae]|uniref:Uncharacterized protein n=1 Tax=Adineta ricciae TaxID=249248 RepID=A0A814Z6V4_ADIRI|nr:unnamed protein product [Adineta ricciae]CAF1502093.1 unnamed protein product [Adineta ricciae]